MMEYVYNNDHANYNYISSFGYFVRCFCCISFQNRFTFIERQDIKNVFLQKKTRNRHDAIVDMHSDMIPYLHEFKDEVSLFWQIPFQLEINCKLVKALKVEEKVQMWTRELSPWIALRFGWLKIGYSLLSAYFHVPFNYRFSYSLAKYINLQVFYVYSRASGTLPTL